MNVKGSSSIYTLSSIVNAKTGGNDPRREDSEVFSTEVRGGGFHAHLVFWQILP